MHWRIGAIIDAIILEQAAGWLQRMQDAPDKATLRAFEAWRATSDAHACAYEKVRATQDMAADLAQEPALLTLRHAALSRAVPSRPGRRWGPRPVAAGILFLAAAPLAAWGYEHWLPHPKPAPFQQTYRTVVGQLADVKLPDGTTVRLDTDSQMHVLFDGDRRLVSLTGQGWFDVHASSRPFVIRAGGHEFGTGPGRFDIRTDPGQVRAFTDRGRLSLAAGSSGISLGGGKLLTIRGEEAAISRLEDPISFTGWRNGLLLFDDVPLAGAAGELNRYRRTPIRIADPDAGALRISGSFKTAETPAFVDALEKGFPVRVVRDAVRGVLIASK